MKWYQRFYHLLWIVIGLVGLGSAASPTIADNTPLSPAVRALSLEIDGPYAVHEIREVHKGEYEVCLDIPLESLAEDGWLGIERTLEDVRLSLTSVPWTSLTVKRWDSEAKTCSPLTDFAPAPETIDTSMSEAPDETRVPSRLDENLSLERPSEPSGGDAETFSRSLVGKTVYVSAGHGWLLYDSSWRTQRIVYEGFIEDHNNAEAVDQYLTPYLENAGARVVPMRERDWNADRVIVDNDDGAPTFEHSDGWYISGGSGYRGSTYRYAVTGGSTETCTWTLSVPETGTYALYAWVYMSSNRAPDAHYVVHHAGGTTDVQVNQWSAYGARRQTWLYLGSFPFYSGTATVTLDNRSSVNGTAVIADALRLGGGSFDSLQGLTDPDFDSSTTPPYRPRWETATYYYSQWMGYKPGSYFNDVVSRPLYTRWEHAESGDDAVYVSWHSNGWKGVTRGTESYVHNGETYPRTEGSLALQAAVHHELIHDIRSGWDPAWIDRGAKQANLGELRMLYDSDPSNRMAGVLIELAFHDQPEDAAALKDPGFNRLAARAIYQGIVRYFETRDGIDLALAPEPPTNLQIRNAGGGTVRVSWRPAPTDTAGLGGEAATAYRVYISPDGFAWGDPETVIETHYDITGLEEGSPIYVRVTGINSGGESFPTETMGARVGDPRLLIINGFDKLTHSGLVREDDPRMGSNARMWIDQINAADYIVNHGQAVPSSYPYGWDSASNEAVEDGSIALGDYSVVDWVLGEESLEVDGTLSPIERSQIETFLAEGGGLLISGSELAWDLDAMGRDPDFLNRVLRSDYAADDAATSVAAGVAGGAFEGLGAFDFNAGGEYEVDFPDVLVPLSGATAALSYLGGTGGTAAIQAKGLGGDGCERVIVMGFPIETLPPLSRSRVMDAALQYVDACRPVRAWIHSPEDLGYYQSSPLFTGGASGESLTGVQVQLVREMDGRYWTGAAWSSDSVWLSASGIEAWSYTLPVELNEGLYTARARAVRATSVQDPVEVSFGIDRTHPEVPTIINPTEGITVTIPPVVLEWTAPQDNGSPLSYRLELDGVPISTMGLTYAASLRSGSHVWRVQAWDAAGNEGAWTDLQHFYADFEEVFLPMILKAR